MESILTDRQKAILEALIQEYVATAEPVSSAVIVRKHHLPYSTATVRNELFSLDREGFLYQPHTSAGRVPTDSGYRFYIEAIQKRNTGEGKRIEPSFRTLRYIDDEFDFLRQASRLLARLSGELSIAGFLERDIFYKAGLAEALRGPEFADEETARQFGELVDFLDEDLEEYVEGSDIADCKVFIGEENPLREARNYTLMIAQSPTPFDEAGVFAILGPRRMDYERNLTLLRTLKKLFNE